MTAGIDEAAVRALREERIDWRFKGMPSEAFGSTVAEFLAQRPQLFDSGFVGPVLTLDAPAMDHNLRTMARWCAQHQLQLAPHGKTTMAPQLFQQQLAHGAWGVTAATISQLRVYRAFGVQRVLFANQLLDEPGLAWLARELDADPDFSFSCLVDSAAGVELMDEVLSRHQTTRPVDVLVELGRPGGRSGTRTRAEAHRVAAAVADSSRLRLVGAAGYEGALASDVDNRALAVIDEYAGELRRLVFELAEQGRFADTPEVIVTCGGSAYFDQVAEALTGPWPEGLPVVPVLRSGAYIVHDDGFYRTRSPFSRQHRLAGHEEPFRPAMRIWARVTSAPEPGLALATMGRRDVSFDQDLPEPQLLRTREGALHELTGCRVTALADQHAFIATGDHQLRPGDWIGFGLSHPCTVFDKWPLIPVVEGETVIDLVRTFF